MRIVLEIVSGALTGERVQIEANQVVRVGRTDTADFPTRDAFMSGEHFLISCDGKHGRVRDLNSRNGTLLNDRKVKEATLHDGDRLFAGKTNFVVKIDESLTTATPFPTVRLQGKGSPEPSSTRDAVHAPVELAPVDVTDVPEPKSVTKERVVSGQPVVGTQGSDPKKGARHPTKTVEAGISHTDLLPDQESPEVQPATGPHRTSGPATPEDRLLAILRDQAGHLYALLDGARDRGVTGLLSGSGEEHQSLYEGGVSTDVTPYLVRLAPRSQVLEKLVRKGWGRGWGVYLASKLPLKEVRDYFRENLMVKTPDGREFFSRFYDPKFFRGFLAGCTPQEADRFFGPITSYLIEGENPDVMLQFTRTARGIETKKRLLLGD
jgi:pSer/pThr/pTyr-binding forkhead associated (FHA) protein